MAYTSIIPVHRLDNSINYIKDKEKTTKPAASAGSLEEAIDYALNRDKTETMVFEDAIGCTCEDAFADMLATKRRFHKVDGVQGYHLIQSFAAGEVSPELAHLIGLELAEQLLKGKYEVVVTTHLNTSHYHNHLVFNSVSMEDGRKYHSNSRSYYEDVRRISDGLCKKYGLSIIQPGGGKGKAYAEWQAEQDGKPTWRTAIRMDIRETVAESFSWRQFISMMEKKTRMVRMLKENRPLKFFTVPSDRLKEFAREGKKRGLLYVVIRDRKNPSQCEIMVFADDAAKVNRVMDKMNLDFLKSESGEAVQEVAMEADRNQEMPEAPTETVEMPEGEIQFELGDMEQDFGFEEPAPDMENFMQAQEERNPSEPSSRSKDISTGQEKSEQDLLNAPEKTEGKEKPSVRAELDQIKQEKQESAKKKENSKNRRQNRSAGRKKRKKAKTKGR